MIKFREWSSDWAIMKPYNGFTHEERVKDWKVLWYLREMKLVPTYPKRCSICDRSDDVSYHGENYYAPEKVYAVCKPCHFILHKRFYKPEPFIELIKQHGVGDKADAWFTKLSLEPFDMAAKSRAEFGPDVTDLVKGLRDRAVISQDCELPEDGL